MPVVRIRRRTPGSSAGGWGFHPVPRPGDRCRTCGRSHRSGTDRSRCRAACRTRHRGADFEVDVAAVFVVLDGLNSLFCKRFRRGSAGTSAAFAGKENPRLRQADSQRNLFSNVRKSDDPRAQNRRFHRSSAEAKRFSIWLLNCNNTSRERNSTACGSESF